VSKLSLKIKNRIKHIFYDTSTHRIFTMPPELQYVADLDRSLKDIENRWGEKTEREAEVDSAAPVFLLSAGWRSGSTLLQRLMCSTGQITIWGEPLGDTGLIPRMAMSLNAISPDWPPESYFSDSIELEEFSSNWIANITPPIDALRKAHRSFMDEWLAKTAGDTYGVEKWGLKEVRLTIEHAKYLKWLYPNARFVFIYRNLFDAYRSWRGNTWSNENKSFLDWPGYSSYSPFLYARHWKLLLSGYLEGYKEVDGYLVKYEDVIAGKVDMQELADYIGIDSIDSSVLLKRVASPDGVITKVKKKHITLIEKWILRMIAGKLLRDTGYR